MEKRYNTDKSKERAREMLRSFIADTLLTYRKPSDIRVLHLPGYDSMEVLQVYDSLGIPRRNITGIERNPTIADHIREVTPDINLHETSLENFIAKQRSLPYDVISLDFTGNLSDPLLDLCYSLSDAIDRNNFIFHMAVQKSRENRFTQQMMHSNTQIYHMSQFTVEARLKGLLPAEDQDRYDNLFDKYTLKNPADISVQRELSLNMIMMLMCTGSGIGDSVTLMMKKMLGDIYPYAVKEAIDYSETVFKVPKGYFEKKYGHLEEYKQDPMMVQEVAASVAYPFLSNVGKIFVEHYISKQIKEYAGFVKQANRHISDNPNMLSMANARQKTLIRRACSVGEEQYQKMADDSDQLAYFISTRLIEGMLSRLSGKYAQVEKLSKYAYVSESGTPMIGDMAYYLTDRKYIKDLETILDSISFHDEIKITDYKNLFRSSIRILKDKKKLAPSDIGETESRQYLGNSSKQILRKSMAVELLRQGNAPEDLAESYRGLSIHALHAINYHLKHGAYDQDSLNEIADAENSEVLVQDINTRSAMAEENVSIGDEILTSADAIQYFRAGISPKEINQAYPNNSLPQLNAWKFWFDRGKYPAGTATRIGA